MNFRQNAAQLLNHAAEQQILNWISLELGTGGAQQNKTQLLCYILSLFINCADMMNKLPFSHYD